MTFTALEEFILEKMSQTKLPGVSIALVDRGEIVYSRGFGFRDVERGLPATPRTLYGIGSVTKSFTCIGLMQLQEQGKLRVDDPVDRHLPLTGARWASRCASTISCPTAAGFPRLRTRKP